MYGLWGVPVCAGESMYSLGSPCLCLGWVSLSELDCICAGCSFLIQLPLSLSQKGSVSLPLGSEASGLPGPVYLVAMETTAWPNSLQSPVSHRNLRISISS